MNIFEARKLQKLLYKDSECDFKVMRTQKYGNKFCYTVSHHVRNDNRFILSENIINRFFYNNKYGVEVHIIHDINCRFNVTKGMYIIEVIVIDD